MPQKGGDGETLLRKAQFILLALPLSYLAFLALLTIPWVQTALIFVHWAKWPLGADFDHPEHFGLAPYRVRNFYLITPDNHTIGLWHALPSSIYQAHVSQHGLSSPIPDSVFLDSLRSQEHPTIVYFHGNAATRAAGHRKYVLRYFSGGAADLNYLVVDYRGFADSSKVTPDEQGLVIDARTVWDYVAKDVGVPTAQVAIMGQSLGTGVSTQLASRLANEGIHPKAVVLVAPFATIARLLETYKLGTVIPVLGPLSLLPKFRTLVLTFLKTKFDSLSAIQNIRAPILLIHSENDLDIPSIHSHTLFSTLLTPYLPSSSPALLPAIEKVFALPASKNLSSPEALALEEAFRSLYPSDLVSHEKLGGYGRLWRLRREGQFDGAAEGRRKWQRGDVGFLQALKGGHNDVGNSETTVALVTEVIRSE